MESPHQTPSLIHDPLGLLALPMTAPGNDPADDDTPRPGAKSSGMAIATNMLRGAMSHCSLRPVSSHCLVPQTTSTFHPLLRSGMQIMDGSRARSRLSSSRRTSRCANYPTLSWLYCT